MKPLYLLLIVLLPALVASCNADTVRPSQVNDIVIAGSDAIRVGGTANYMRRSLGLTALPDRSRLNGQQQIRLSQAWTQQDACKAGCTARRI